MNCDDCKHYEWYYDRCRKWDCEVDGREVHNCFEPMKTPILDAMIKGANVAQRNANERLFLQAL